MRRALVLFTGTGSIDRSLEEAGFHVDSLDIDPKCNPTWCSDIMEWDAWTTITPGTYDFIWAYPLQHSTINSKDTSKFRARRQHRAARAGHHL